MNFDEVISLGDSCQTAFQIRRFYGIERASIFDWLVTPIDALRRAISNDCHDLFQVASLRPLARNHDEHCLSLIDDVTKIQYLHEFQTGEDFALEAARVKSKYDALGERWRTTMAEGARILFIRHVTSAAEAKQGAVRKLHTLLARTYPGIDPYLLIVNASSIETQPVIGRMFRSVDMNVSDQIGWEGSSSAWDSCLTAVNQKRFWERSVLQTSAEACGS